MAPNGQTQIFAPWADPAAKPLIEFRNVSKRFGNFTAIDNLNLSIYEREFFALLGPSGCGKTTLMRLLAGFEPLSAGIILLDGQDISPIPPNLRAVNMMFQSYALFPHLSVWENIAFGLRRETRDKEVISQRVAEMLRLTRLAKFANRKPHQISGGQRQRVALARALAKAPKLLLLDEPLGALDKQLREKMQFEITNLAHALGITVVYVTHDQTEALTMSDRVAVFNDGRIQQLASPDQLYEEPENSFVAQFIGENNTLHGEIREINKKKAVVQLDSGQLIDCKPVNVNKVGDRTCVSIRPERVEYNQNRMQKGAHTLKAEVLEFIYMGDLFRTRLRVAGNDEFIIKTRNAPDQTRLQPGQEIEIGWLPEDCRALDA